MEAQREDTVWGAVQCVVRNFNFVNVVLRALVVKDQHEEFIAAVDAVDEKLKEYNASGNSREEVLCFATLTKNLQCETSIYAFVQTLLATLLNCKTDNFVTMTRLLEAAQKNQAVLKALNRQLCKVDAIHRENIAVGEKECFKIHTYDFHPFLLARISKLMDEKLNFLDQNDYLFVSSCRRAYRDHLELHGETPSHYAPMRVPPSGRNVIGYNTGRRDADITNSHTQHPVRIARGILADAKYLDLRVGAQADTPVLHRSRSSVRELNAMPDLVVGSPPRYPSASMMAKLA